MTSEGSRLWAGAWLAGRCVCCLFVWGGYIHLSWAVSTFGLWLGVGRSSIDRWVRAAAASIEKAMSSIQIRPWMGLPVLILIKGAVDGSFIVMACNRRTRFVRRPAAAACLLPPRCWGCCGRVNQNRPPQSKSASPVRVVCNDVHLMPPWPPRGDRDSCCLAWPALPSSTARMPQARG